MLFLWGWINSYDNWSWWKVWLFSVLVIYLLMKDACFFCADQYGFDIRYWTDEEDGGGGLTPTMKSRVFLFGLLGPIGVVITWVILQFAKIVITTKRIPTLIGIIFVFLLHLISPIFDKYSRKGLISNMYNLICLNVLMPIGAILLTLFSLLPFGALILACTPMGKLFHPDYYNYS